VSRLTLVVAVADNGVIGRGGNLAWRLPADLRRFQHSTMGYGVIVGRTTFESLPAPLSGRRVVVLSRDPDFAPPRVEVARSLPTALRLLSDDEEVFVAGGGDVYRQALPLADRLVVTRVHADVEGDVFFPPIDGSEWQLLETEERPADAANQHAMTFEVYVRRYD